MHNPRHIKLSGMAEGPVRVLADVSVSDRNGNPSSWITLTRTGHFSDPRYGEFDITHSMLMKMAENFNNGVFGQDVFIDVDHKPGNGAAARILAVRIEGDRFRAQVEWTPYGIDAVKNKGYRYLSLEYHEQWRDNEKQLNHGPVMLGAGLTIRPVIKGLDPIRLSAGTDDGIPVFIHPELQSTLLQEQKMKYAELLRKLTEALKARKLAAPIIANLVDTATKVVQLAADEVAAQEIIDRFDDAGRQLAEHSSQSVQLSVNIPEGIALSADDVSRLLAQQLDERERQRTAQAASIAANERLLSELITADQGLDEDTRVLLSEQNRPLVAGMTEEQVRQLAAVAIAGGQREIAARRLSSMGFPAAIGQVHQPNIAVVHDDAIRLSGQYRERLALTDLHRQGRLRLLPKETTFIERVLSCFDQLHGAEIATEAKILAGGTVNMGNTNLPVGFRREVIREALSDLRVLELVQTLTDFQATTTTQIPYELRDTSAIVNDAIVFEGKPIPPAGIGQYMDTAYILPMKLAMVITNEVVHFSQASAINWDAMARNIESNARILRELVCRRIMNHLQRASDSYAAVPVSAESFASQLDGTKSTIKTVNFPIVRQHQDRDLQGTAIGNAENPITVVLNGTTLLPYDGTGEQVAGTYYRVTSYNLGYIQFVNQLGAPATPTATGACTASYSRATNVMKFDLDVPAGVTTEVHLNGLLRAVGSRKAMMSGQRYVEPDFLLTSPVLHDTMTNAEQFTAAGKRNGSDTTNDGDLERVKNIPAFGTNAPGVDLGDERILIGQRGLLGYVIAKPFVTNQPFEMTDSQGRPIGKRQAYGEEYSAIKVPKPVANRMTSVLAYSASNR